MIIDLHEVGKILEYLKRNNAQPFDKGALKASWFSPYFVSQDMMIFQDEVRLFYFPKDVRPLLLSQYSWQNIKLK